MLPEKLYHATYKQFLKSIQLNGLGNTDRKMWSDSVNGTVYLADDPLVAESYAEEAEWLDEIEDSDSYLENIIILEVDVAKLDQNKIAIDKNVLLDEGEENYTWEYHGIIPWEACKIYDNSLIEWKSLNNNQKDFTDNFKKLVAHLKTLFGCRIIQLDSDSLEVDLAFGYNRQKLEIFYHHDQDVFSIRIIEIKTKQIMLDFGCPGNWEDVLYKLQEKGYIKDKKLCERLSTIDEIKLYNNLWK